MSVFRGNIKSWLDQSEPDYYMFFLKAWIPFNAWYVAELPQFNKKDSKIIQELQRNPLSKPRTVIEAMLAKDAGYEASLFRVRLAELHHSLEKKRLTHNGELLTFTRLLMDDNPIEFEKDLDTNGNIYKAETKVGYYQALIVNKQGKTFLDYKNPTFDIDHLRKDTDFIRINDKKIQDRIVKCFTAINPKLPTNLVSTSKDKAEYILLESEQNVKFINSPSNIAKGCIHVLYALRCMLFHGEIEPSNSNKQVFEHAYHLLRFIIKELH